MAVKGVISKNIIAGNSYKFLVDQVEILCTEISSIEETMQKVELPDGTQASGGRTEGGMEFTVMVPAHHKDEIDFMDSWLQACKDPVQPSAYKTTTVLGTSKDGTVTRTDTLLGCWVSARSGAEYSMEDGGTTFAQIEYTISFDDVEHA